MNLIAKSLYGSLFLLLAFVSNYGNFSPRHDRYLSKASTSINCVESIIKVSRKAGLSFRWEEKFGPRLTYKAGDNVRDINSIETLNIMQYNVENWLDPTKGKRKKPDDVEYFWRRIKKQTTHIKQQKPDILVMEEVGDEKLVQGIIDKYLPDYHLFYIPGNSTRDINVAMLMKKDLPFDAEYQSFKNLETEYMGNVVPAFSRDLPALSIKPKGASDEESPLMTIFGTHFKSKRDGHNDPQSFIRRSKQVEEAVELMEFVGSRYGEDTPMFIAGDFNTEIDRGEELIPLWQNGYIDGFQALRKPVESKIVTHSFFPREGSPQYNQLDAVIGNSIAANRSAREESLFVRGRVIREVNQETGEAYPIPKSFQERRKQLSDHFGISFDLDFKKILAKQRNQKKGKTEVLKFLPEENSKLENLLSEYRRSRLKNLKILRDHRNQFMIFKKGRDLVDTVGVDEEVIQNFAYVKGFKIKGEESFWYRDGKGQFFKYNPGQDGIRFVEKFKFSQRFKSIPKPVLEYFDLEGKRVYWKIQTLLVSCLKEGKDCGKALTLYAGNLKHIEIQKIIAKDPDRALRILVDLDLGGFAPFQEFETTLEALKRGLINDPLRRSFFPGADIASGKGENTRHYLLKFITNSEGLATDKGPKYALEETVAKVLNDIDELADQSIKDSSGMIHLLVDLRQVLGSKRSEDLAYAKKQIQENLKKMNTLRKENDLPELELVLVE